MHIRKEHRNIFTKSRADKKKKPGSREQQPGYFFHKTVKRNIVEIC